MSQIIRTRLLSIVDTMENANTILLQLLTGNTESNATEFLASYSKINNSDDILSDYVTCIDNNYEDLMELLTECQNCAIEIGNKIEKIYGENISTISTLETYCEYVYQLAQSMDNPESVFEKYKKLCHQVISIRKSIEKEIPNKKEIVFFPYKASMWDSLESIYLAAKEDPDCDAYCVPIPYYEKNPDGTLGQMHYEFQEYPNNIEVIHYLEYDFKERRPDAIYIHNPYDNWNHVTSVHPDYYSKILRDYTDQLIYIPYFVLSEIEPTNQTAIDGMKHFCFLPGTIYANKVILQSEDMKQIYVNEFIKAAAENGLSGPFTDRKTQEEKFLGLGSPKLDKVTNTQNVSIPDDWLPYVQKADGTYKKIVLYNTTIATFLAHKETMLTKIENTLEFFYHEKEQVTLLWRPHPLMENTIKSMHPEFLDQYLKIVNQYKQENWGIYDDSADLNRAIAISDCYYGDGSSVVQLYKQTGKPIMIQNINILY